MMRKTLLGTCAATVALLGPGLVGCSSDDGGGTPPGASDGTERGPTDRPAEKEGQSGGRESGNAPDRPREGGSEEDRTARAEVTVQRIVDGDTLVVAGDGSLLPAREAVRVRLLEVDTPEVGACFADKATARTSALLPVGSTVRVERDEDLKDPYGRYLLYVWNDQEQFVNLSLVRGGFAKAVLFPPNDEHWQQISSAGDKAEAGEAGLWAGCDTKSPPREKSRPSDPGDPGRPDKPKPSVPESEPERQPEREPRSPDTPRTPPEPDSPAPDAPSPEEPSTPSGPPSGTPGSG